MIRYGVIGTGLMGCEHIRNIAAIETAAVAAIADPIQRSRQWAIDACRADWQPAVFEDYRHMLASAEIDVVLIATPNFTHRAVLDDVFETNLHVFVEKPLCTTLSDCRHVAERAASHKGIVWVGLEYRYMPPVAAFLAELAGGSVGDLKMLSIREHRYPFLEKVGDWNRLTKNTGGTLVEKCCHFFDLMNLAVRTEPVSVFASGGQDVNHLDEVYGGERSDILDNAFVIVDYENGVRAHHDLCMFAEASREEQELCAVGDAGKLECTVPGGVITKGNRKTRSCEQYQVPGDPRILHDGYHWGASYLEHLALIESIREGKPPAVSVEEGMKSVAIGLAAHRSIEARRLVHLEEL